MFKRIYPILNIDEVEFLLMWSGTLGRAFSVLLALLVLVGGMTEWITERHLQAGLMGLSILVVFFVSGNLLMVAELRRLRKRSVLIQNYQEYDLSTPGVTRRRNRIPPLTTQRKYIDPTNNSWDEI